MLEKIVNMNNGILLLLMFFLHIYADFNMQGIMAEMKQFKFWEKYHEKYKYDFVMPLIGHSFQWSFFLHLPIILYAIYTGNLTLFCIYSIVINTFIHAIIDTLKANHGKTTLIQDQFLHILQIIAIWVIFCKLK